MTAKEAAMTKANGEEGDGKEGVELVGLGEGAHKVVRPALAFVFFCLCFWRW